MLIVFNIVYTQRKPKYFDCKLHNDLAIIKTTFLICSEDLCANEARNSQGFFLRSQCGFSRLDQAWLQGIKTNIWPWLPRKKKLKEFPVKQFHNSGLVFQKQQYIFLKKIYHAFGELYIVYSQQLRTEYFVSFALGSRSAYKVWNMGTKRRHKSAELKFQSSTTF